MKISYALLFVIFALCGCIILLLPLHVQHTGQYTTCPLECILSYESIRSVVKVCKSECGAGGSCRRGGRVWAGLVVVCGLRVAAVLVAVDRRCLMWSVQLGNRRVLSSLRSGGVMCSL